MRVALFSLLLLLLTGCAPPPAPPDPALWGSLKPGPYAVGFGLRWETDSSRVYGLEKDGVTKKPRPIPVGVWYPARTSPAEHMQVADYFDMRSKQVQFDDLANTLNAHIRDILAQSMGDPTAVNRFLAMRTGATFDAPPAKGQFPVIIYCPGGSYEEDFVLFEYLASNGYVVLSTSDHSDNPAAPWSINERTLRLDLYFLQRFAALLGNADASHVASMGYGYGAANALAWASEGDTPLDAVIGFEPKWPFPDGSPATTPNPRVARLIFSAARDAPDGSLEVVVPGLTDGNFIGDRIVRETARPHRPDYDGVCRLTLLFLDAHLKRNPAALAEFQRLSQNPR
jgi:hypothetical protein